MLRALERKPVDVTPVWMMRQAGRYLPEYRAARKRAGDFMSLCRNPQLACEVSLQPLERFAFDAAILFSDILTIPDAMGLGLYFAEGEGPRFRKPIRKPADVEALPSIDAAVDLAYVMDAVALIRRELNGRAPLIGFSGSPWTLATYMIEGSGSKDFQCAKQFLYDHPEACHLLLGKLEAAVADYLNAQIRAGAQVVQIFDTWGGILSTPAYLEFSLPYMQRIVDSLVGAREGRTVPCVLFTRQGGLWLEEIAASGCHCVGLDWTVDIGQARSRIGHKVALQGNMDPSVLYAAPQAIRREVAAILRSHGPAPGHIFNLGHGVTPGVDPDHVAVFVDAVHEYSAAGAR